MNTYMLDDETRPSRGSLMVRERKHLLFYFYFILLLKFMCHFLFVFTLSLSLSVCLVARQSEGEKECVCPLMGDCTSTSTIPYGVSYLGLYVMLFGLR